MTRIETYRVFGLCVAVATGGAMLQGCSDDNAGTGSPLNGTAGASTSATSTTAATGTSSTAGTGAGGAGSTGTGGGSNAVTYCTPAANEPTAITMGLISDFEGEGGTLVQSIMPGGFWDADVDGTGTAKTESIKVEPCGTTGNGLHFKGTGHTVWGADAAAAIIDQTKPANVSMFSGMSFVVKSAAGLSVIFKVQAPYSQPGCGKCIEVAAPAGEECYSGYIKTVPTTTDSTATVVKWTDLTQQTWGYRAPGAASFDPKNLVSIAFAFDKGMDFDVCIDDVKFIP
jgi:hypothetical protein